MDLSSAFININWLSVLTAALSSFLLGGLWYGPLFGRIWMNENNFSEEDLKKRSMTKTFGLSIVLAIIAAFILDMFIGHKADLITGFFGGFFAG